MAPEHASKEAQNQDSQQNTATEAVPTQGKAEDYYQESAQQIADYFNQIYTHTSKFFDTEIEKPAKDAILKVLSELEPYTTECEWNGTSFETYEKEFKTRFTTACLNDPTTNSILANLAMRIYKNYNPTEIINDFLSSFNIGNPSFQDFHDYLKSAQKVYSYSYENEYEAYRVEAKKETLLPAMKKLFLRRLDTKRDEIINQKVRPKNIDARNFPRLKITGQSWSPIVNDAFVGGGIDAGARFKISDLSDDTMKKIADLSNADLPTEGEKSKLEQFWDICKTDPNLYKEGESYRYTVLAREIAQLLKKGWIFKTFARKTFPRKEGPETYYENNNLNLIAFKDENAANEYSGRKMKVRQEQQSAKDQAPTGT